MGGNKDTQLCGTRVRLKYAVPCRPLFSVSVLIGWLKRPDTMPLWSSGIGAGPFGRGSIATPPQLVFKK